MSKDKIKSDVSEEISFEEAIEQANKMESNYVPNLEDNGKTLYQTLPLLTFPNSLLKQKSKPVEEEEFGTDELEATVINMFGTMKVNHGIGLAAPQVGIFKQICIFSWVEGYYFIMINPEIISVGEKDFEFEEGCLSVPGYFENRKRPGSCVVRFRELDGNEREVEFSGIYAFSVQHEIDHLNGKTFVDDHSMLKKMRIKNKIEKTLRKKIK